jgi:hypothetical protein
MAKDPRFVVWRLEPATAKDLHKLERTLFRVMRLDHVFTDAVMTLRQGKEQSQRVEHRIGDYFDRVCTLPSDKGEARSLRLFFQRKPGVNRYWKDVMAMVLKHVKSADARASLALDYRVDDDSSATAATKVPSWFSHLSEKSRLFWKLSAEVLLHQSDFTFADLAGREGISIASLRAMHRNSYRAIEAERAPDPLWSKWDHAAKRNIYTMDRVVRDEILSLTQSVPGTRQPRNVA